MSNLTDYELNRAIAELVYPDNEVYTDAYQPLTMVSFEDYEQEVNYCNNWNDLMPLVVEHDLLNETNQNPIFYDTLTLGEVLYKEPHPQLALAQCLCQVLLAKTKEKE